MSQSPPGARDYALLMLLAIIWGASFMIIKIGVESLPAATLTASRLALAAALLLAVARFCGESLPRGGTLWGWIVASALFGNALPFTLISWGEETIDSGLAAILMAVMPLTTVLVAHLFTQDEKLTRRKAAGVLLGLAGLLILIGPEKLAGLGDDTVRQLAVASAAFCYGLNAVITRRFADQPPRALVAAGMLGSTTMLVPLSILVEQPWTLAPSGRSLMAMVVLG
ncbi:MAG: DMT family transporter, partial [Methyloligellaceae bacterium]